MRSEALLALPPLTAVEGRRILIIRGQGGRELLQETLSARGARVDCLECYRRAAPPFDSAHCMEQLARTPVELILVSSGDGLLQLSRLLTPRENTNLAGTALIAPSQRVADMAAEQGWRSVRCAENASDAAMLEAARAWASVRQGER
jgi:uroporphyrinogen-III synthase